MKDKTDIIMLMIVIYIITSIYTVVLAQHIDTRTVSANKSYVMLMCSQSHDVHSYFAEKACGDAQDQYNLEFLCDGTSQQAACWVEEK